MLIDCSPLLNADIKKYITRNVSSLREHLNDTLKQTILKLGKESTEHVLQDFAIWDDYIAVLTKKN